MQISAHTYICIRCLFYHQRSLCLYRHHGWMVGDMYVYMQTYIHLCYGAADKTPTGFYWIMTKYLHNLQENINWMEWKYLWVCVWGLWKDIAKRRNVSVYCIINIFKALIIGFSRKLEINIYLWHIQESCAKSWNECEIICFLIMLKENK